MLLYLSFLFSSDSQKCSEQEKTFLRKFGKVLLLSLKIWPFCFLTMLCLALKGSSNVLRRSSCVIKKEKS